jgi:hypothetical protein
MDWPSCFELTAALWGAGLRHRLLIGGTEVTDKGLMSLVGWHSLRRVTRTAMTTKAGSKAFNESFLAARRKAWEAGEPMDPRDIPPVLLDHGPE